MGNRWHANQTDNQIPDVKAKPCPWCDSESVVVDTTLIELEHVNVWEAQATCHECGAKSPDTDFPSWDDRPLHDDYSAVDWEDEREVVNLAVKIWNYRI